MVITTLFSMKMIPSLEIYWNQNFRKHTHDPFTTNKKKTPIEIDGCNDDDVIFPKKKIFDRVKERKCIIFLYIIFFKEKFTYNLEKLSSGRTPLFLFYTWNLCTKKENFSILF